MLPGRCAGTNPTEASPGTHAEAVEIVFDQEQTSFRDTLEFFFQIHDPTTKDRQGDETGSHVRSAIFYTSDEQRRRTAGFRATVSGPLPANRVYYQQNCPSGGSCSLAWQGVVTFTLTKTMRLATAP